MNCKSCGSVLHYINVDEGIVQCPNCNKKYRVKKPASNNMNSFSQNQDWTKQMYQAVSSLILPSSIRPVCPFAAILIAQWFLCSC